MYSKKASNRRSTVGPFSDREVVMTSAGISGFEYEDTRVVLVALTADKVVCVASAPDNVLEKRPKGARTVVEVFCVASPRLVDRAALDAAARRPLVSPAAAPLRGDVQPWARRQ